MDGPLALLALGFLLGMRHATDADHVIAVTTIVSRERKLGRAASLGALWGIGHTATVLAVGVPVVLFGLVVPARVGLSLEFSVALMLVLLGVLNLAEFFRRLHGAHPHGAVHESGASAEAPARLDRRQALRSLGVGVVHGLAGSAAVALLVLSQAKSLFWGVLYLVLFGAGTVAGMAAVTAMLAAPLAYAGSRARRLGPHFAWVSGLMSLTFGCFLVYQTGFVEGLFVAHP